MSKVKQGKLTERERVSIMEQRTLKNVSNYFIPTFALT